MIKIINYIKVPIFALITLTFIYGGINLAQAKNEISSLKNTKPNTISMVETPKIEAPTTVKTIEYSPVSEKIQTPENPTIVEEPALIAIETVITPTPAKNVKKTSSKNTTSNTIEEPKPTPTIEINVATIKIDNVGTYQVEIANSDTAFSILKKAAAQNDFSISYDSYDFGVFVTTIGGIKANNSQFWAFYYNGAFSSVGASDQKISQDDVISWKLQSF
jgi:hypothetical protein